VFFYGKGGSTKGEKICKVAQEIGSLTDSVALVRKSQKTDANENRVGTNGESTVLFGNADEVTGNCSEEKTPTLACQSDTPP
jgi:hypothetical protein